MGRGWDELLKFVEVIIIVFWVPEGGDPPCSPTLVNGKSLAFI